MTGWERLHYAALLVGILTASAGVVFAVPALLRRRPRPPNNVYTFPQAIHCRVVSLDERRAQK